MFSLCLPLLYAFSLLSQPSSMPFLIAIFIILYLTFYLIQNFFSTIYLLNHIRECKNFAISTVRAITFYYYNKKANKFSSSYKDTEAIADSLHPPLNLCKQRLEETIRGAKKFQKKGPETTT